MIYPFDRKFKIVKQLFFFSPGGVHNSKNVRREAVVSLYNHDSSSEGNPEVHDQMGDRFSVREETDRGRGDTAGHS